MTKQVFAVVHVQDRDQAYRNLRVAEDTGCDGVFLISHDAIFSHDLWSLYFQMRRSSRLLLGINQLCLDAGTAMIEAHTRSQSVGLRVSMLWTDNYKNTAGTCPDQVRDYQLRLHKDSLQYFGGVAFKHQLEEHLRGDELVRETRAAAQHVDVLTTSGVATGTAPDLDKIRTMRDALGPNKKLAIASGVTPENVEIFLPYVDSFLVATGISKDFFNLDSARTHSLVRRVKT